MKILIIVPAYNEEENILKTIENLKLVSQNIDYIIINDGSTDNTKQICIDKQLKFIDLSNNLGIGGSVQTGYKFAEEKKYDIAIQFDGDAQHNAEYIKALIEEIKKGYDIVIGSRYMNNKSKFKSTSLRRVGKNFLSFLIKITTKTHITDPTSGFRAVNKKIIKEFAKNYPVDYPEPDTIVRLLKKGYKISEIPVEMNARENGKSSIGSIKSIYYMIKVSVSIIISALSTHKEEDKEWN